MLHSHLHEQGHDPVSIFFKSRRPDAMALPTEREYALLEEAVEAAAPLFVGLSVRSTYAPVAKEISRRLRAKGHLVVWGGSHPTVAPEDAGGYADAVCVGEGEGAILDLIDRLEGGGYIGGIPNVWALRAGEREPNPMRPLIPDLDVLPFPWWESSGCLYVEDDSICDTLPADAVTSHDVMTSRGCFYRCSYCIHSKLFEMSKGLGQYVRRRSPETVVAELEYNILHFPQANRVRFWDEVFTFSPKWIERFVELYRERIGLPFFCYTTAGLTNSRPEILVRLASAGLRYISMGIQSGSERVRRDVYERPSSNEALREAAHRFRELGLFAEYDLIIDNPFETEEDHASSLDFLLSLPRPFRLFQHSLTFFPHYTITDRALAEGLLRPEQVEHVEAKSLRQWQRVFAASRSASETFWSNLFYLSQFRIVPRRLIRALARSHFLRRHARGFNAALRKPGLAAERLRTVSFLLREHGWRRVASRLARRLGLGRAAAAGAVPTR